MSVDSRRSLLKSVKQRNYLNKDFDGFYGDLQEYARTFFPNKIKNLSENSLGGLLVEMPAFIGDVQSFYLDHMFHESSPDTAIEPRNIEKHLKDSGIPIVGAAPSVVTNTFYIKVPKETGSNPAFPMVSALPVIYEGSVTISEGGVNFELTENIDFTETNADGSLKAVVEILPEDVDADNNPTAFKLSRPGICISGLRATESFDVGSFEKFKKFSLSKENITEVISVADDLGNTYYEVEYLTQDTVFKATINRNEDNEFVKDNLEIIPAPYRFTKEMSLTTRLVTLTFGGGNAQTLNDDIVPDPSEFALPLYGKRTFSRFSLNPGNLLETSTLGVIAPNTTITVNYRYGGGLSHNIPANSIRGVPVLKMGFPNSPSATVASYVRNSADANNARESSGGEDAPTLDELKLRIPGARNSQNRVVTSPDLLTRIYKMPSNFGRVFRCAVLPNPTNPLATRLYVICRNSNSELIMASDSLKKNLALYLNEYRLISDAVDILDCPVINLQIEFKIIGDPQQNNKQLVLQNVLTKLKAYFNVKNYELNQPISIEHVRNILFNNPGVIGIQDLKFKSITGVVGSRTYSPVQFDVNSNTFRGFIIGPPGSMFEIKYKDQDIIGTII